MTTLPTLPTPTPRNLFVSSIRLTAGLTAVRAAREFTRRTLRHWHLPDVLDSAELVVSELATNAVRNTGSEDGHQVVGVQLRLMDALLYIEVWDPGQGAAVVPVQSLDAEGGRGLFLVESLCERWDTYRPEAGGKVVWGRLTLTGPVDGVHSARKSHCPGTDRQGPTDENASALVDLVDKALVQRALDGFRQLPA
jgi:anti-sigma regulatory factor (Ser/Thr protein kinase)